MICSRTIVFQFLNVTDVQNETEDIVNAIKVLIKYKSRMRNQTKNILKKSNTADVPSLVEEMGSVLFKDGISNEGIIEMFYFCNKLAKIFEASKCENYVFIIAECVSQYLFMFVDDWIVHNGGWTNIIQLANEKSNTCLCAFLSFFI